MKYQFDAWRGLVSISWAGESLNHSWQSARDGVSMKILLPITILGWRQQSHRVIEFCHIWICEMSKSVDKPNCVNGIGTFQGDEDALHRTSVRSRPSQTTVQRLHHVESKFVDLRVCSVNGGTLRGRSEEIVVTLERRSVDICCVQETKPRGMWKYWIGYNSENTGG